MQKKSVPEVVQNVPQSEKKQENVDVMQKNKLDFTKPIEEKDFMHKEPVVFDVDCHVCLMPGEMRLCQTSIPYFDDIVIMSFTCQFCGAHSTETKNGGEVPENAIQITLKVQDENALKRDLFKSQTCKVRIPQAEVELDYGTLGGQYTTVQGLVAKVYEQLGEKNPFVGGDEECSQRMKEVLADLKKMKQGEKTFTLHLIDPLSRSFLENPYEPEEDKKAQRVIRKRTAYQNYMLGYTDMEVDNYK